MKWTTKVCLWSWGRKSEVTGLRWDQLRSVGGEYHFEVIGKWGIDKWFRIPEPLHRELVALKTDSPYVFGVYKQQLRRFHERGPRPWLAQRVSGEFDPQNLGDWFYGRVQEWSEGSPGGRAYLHVFRKTSLQYARSGEDLNRQVAADARLGVSVMLTSYVKETDEEMRAKSNRTYRRIAASLPPEVARRYGYEEAGIDPLVQRLQDAVARQDWGLVAHLTAELQGREGVGPSPVKICEKSGRRGPCGDRRAGLMPPTGSVAGTVTQPGNDERASPGSTGLALVVDRRRVVGAVSGSWFVKSCETILRLRKLISQDRRKSFARLHF